MWSTAATLRSGLFFTEGWTSLGPRRSARGPGELCDHHRCDHHPYGVFPKLFQEAPWPPARGYGPNPGPNVHVGPLVGNTWAGDAPPGPVPWQTVELPSGKPEKT